jgi:hypothetical protein
MMQRLPSLPEATMGHDWIFDVLADLRRYAQANGLPATADGAEALLRVAKAEVAQPGGGEGNGTPGQGGGTPPRSFSH